YVPRTLIRSNIDNQVSKEVYSFEDILDATNISYIYGEGGCGKTEFLKYFTRSIDDERIIIILKCSEVSTALQELKTQSKSSIVFKKLFDKFKSTCNQPIYCSEEDFKSILINHQFVLVFDGLDEIVTEELTKKFIDAVKEYYEHAYAHSEKPPKLIFTGRRETDSNKLSFFHKGHQMSIECLRLEKFNDDNIKQLINNLFLKLSVPEKGNQFYLAISDIDKELKSNPLLLTQLALVYKEKEVVPKTILEIFDNVIDVLFKNDELNKQLSLDNKYSDMTDSQKLKYWLKKFAMERYISLSDGEDLSEEKIFKIIFEKTEKFEETEIDSRTTYLVEFLKNRSILIENKFFHKSLLEYFTAVGFFETMYKGGTINSENLQKLFTHYNDSYWDSVLEMFFIKADNELSKEKMKLLLKIILKNENIIDYTLIFNSCQKQLRHKLDIECLLVKDILIKSTTGVFPPYGPLCYYVPEYNTFESCIFALNEKELKGNAKALALVRDVCFIYGLYNNIKEMTNAVDGKVLFDAAEKDLSGVRKALCEIFYLGDTSYKGGEDIYPRCFNVLETKLLRDRGYGILGRMIIPFEDELGLFKHKQYNEMNGEYVGLISCPNDRIEVEIKLNVPYRCRKLTCIAFTPTEEKDFEIYRFYRGSIKQLYLDEFCCNADWLYPLFNTTRFIIVKETGISYFNNKISISEGVTIVESKEFISFCKLEEVKLPSSLQTIGNSAFANCKNLKKLEISEGVTVIEPKAFAGCISLEKVKLPTSLQTIGNSAFANCKNLKKIEIPEGVTIIEYDTFAGCISLEKVKLPTSLQIIESYAFSNCENIIDIEINKCIIIKINAFNGCKKIESLLSNRNIILSGGKKIKDLRIRRGEGIPLSNSVFIPSARISVFKKVQIPEGIKNIKYNMYSGFRNLQEIKLPLSLQTIESNAFMMCEDLIRIEIPEGVTIIGPGAFSGCKSLEEVKLPSSLQEIELATFENCTNLKKIVIPEGVTIIGPYAFAGCKSLEEVKLPSSLQTIGDNAFENCENLEKLEISPKVISIGEFAFYNCIRMKELLSGNTVLF
ncbi:MAG: leucine-rich repeat protein, partial [Anaeroplasmataceae bacterium]|nr:leucine-rich repeat protein [Anaeroplasmataceae bacterium]